MISELPKCEDPHVDVLLEQARAAWSAWQEQLRIASEDPEVARLFAARAAEAWVPVQEAALKLGLAMLSQPNPPAARPVTELFVVPAPALVAAEDDTAAEVAGQVASPELDPPMPLDASAEPVAEFAPACVPMATRPIVPAPKPLAEVAPDTLRMLQASMSGAREAKPVAPVESVLGRMRAAVGRTPRRDLDAGLYRNQVLSLPQKVVWNDLVALDQEERYLVLTWLAARVRMLQDQAYLDRGASLDGLTKLFKMLTRALEFGVARRVHGLARAHEPLHGSWLQDALAAEEKIDELTGRSLAAPPVPGRSRDSQIDDAFRRLRTLVTTESSEHWLPIVDELVALGVKDADPRWVGPLAEHLDALADTVERQRIARAVTSAVSESQPEPAPHNDWPYLALTRGKRAVILGGDGRQERIPRLKERFDFAVLEWPAMPEGSPRAVQTEVKKLKSGKYDIAIVLQRFIGHSVTDKVFALKVPGLTVVLAEGYGTGQIQEGLERFLGRGQAA
ncbi:MAG: hypothetical protein ACOYOB_20830 [Myxococcota bacterium]